MDERIADFLKYIDREKRYSLNTLQAYENDLREYADFCESDLRKDILSVGVTDVREWVVRMSEGDGKVGPRTIKRRISALRSFYKFLKMSGKVKRNPAAVLILPKTAKPLPKFFRDEEMEKVLNDVMIGEEFEDRRNKLIVDMFYQTGVRVSELVGITDRDVDTGRGTVRVIGKRRKERVIPLGNGIIEEIKEYIRERDDKVGRTAYLFVRKTGQQMYRRGIYDIVHRYMSMVSTQEKRSPHVLRHTFASSMLNSGADIYAVKTLLGHSSLAATEIYTHTSFARLMRMYKTAHPRA